MDMLPFVILCAVFALLHAPLVRRWPGGSTPADKAGGALGVMLIVTGVAHFTQTERFAAMIPSALPEAKAWVHTSGAAALLLGVLLLIPRLRRGAGRGAVLLFVVIWPANLYAAMSGGSADGFSQSPAYLWARVVFQLAYVGWAAWVALGHLPFGEFRRRMFAKHYDKLQAPYEKYHSKHRRRLLAEASGTVVEIGPGTGVNLSYYPKDVRWIGIEPNPFMRAVLQEKAADHPLDVELRDLDGDRLPFDDESVDFVVSTLVLCSVPDPDRTVAEIRRILKPTGRFVFIEHVAAPRGTLLRTVQMLVKPIWQVMADGCCPDRELGNVIRRAGFAEVSIEEYRVPRGASIPIVSPHLMGCSTK